MSLSNALVEYMQRTNRDQSELAEALGVSQPTVSRWVSAASMPGRGSFDTLAELLGVDRDQIAVWAASVTVEERIARLEQKVDQILAALEQREG